jgi:hypothetical protein
VFCHDLRLLGGLRRLRQDLVNLLSRCKALPAEPHAHIGMSSDSKALPDLIATSFRTRTLQR